MPTEPPVRQVQVSFVGTPPVRQVERAAGVSEVETDGSILRCLVCGSFQPFLEALRGHEVVGFDSTPARTGTAPGAPALAHRAPAAAGIPPPPPGIISGAA